jgi:site-specific DNA-methyltransferase (adenine-specific)
MMVTGTHHNMPSVSFGLQQLDASTLNSITWHKKAPPPNLGCRSLTHSSETILWVKPAKESKHFFNYKASRVPWGKQMHDVWHDIGRPTKIETVHGRHPTQKPVALVERCLSFAAPDGGLVLDPFNGHGTTGVAAMMERRDLRYIGIEMASAMIKVSKMRLEDARR